MSYGNNQLSGFSMLRHKLVSVTFALALVTAAPAWSALTEPARIGDHAKSLTNRIEFPAIDGDFTIFVRCEAKVFPAGNIDEIGCYSEGDLDPAFYRAVSIAGASASVLPAMVNGDRVSILMLFSVIFKQQGDTQTIVVVPNHGTNAKSLGLSYIAPQRYGRGIRYTPRAELGLLWIDAMMSAQGKASKIKYLETRWTNKETKRYAKSYINDNTFIPGHLNGTATKMRFVKPIFGYRNGFMWDHDTSRCKASTISCDEVSNITGKPRFAFDD